MPNSYQLHVTATSTAGPFSFAQIDGYLSSSHIKVSLNGAVTAAFTMNEVAKTITLSSATAAGTAVRIYRQTPNTVAGRVTDFVDGSVLTAQDLDAAALQTLYITQEAEDTGSGSMPKNYAETAWNAGGLKLENVAAPTVGSDATTKTYVDTKFTTDAMILSGGHWDGESKKIQAVADPVAATDAATKNYVDTKLTTDAMILSGGHWDGESKKIQAVADPAAATDAATKNYVDNKFVSDAMILSGGQWDGENKRVQNLATPVASTDAATKGYADSATVYGAGVATPQAWSFNGNGSAVSFTLNPVAQGTDPNMFLVEVGGVIQRPTTNYTIPNTATITFVAAPPSGTNNIVVRNFGVARNIAQYNDLVTFALGATVSGGNLTVDTDTLFVDATNNQVGVKTVTPAAGYALDVNGRITVGAADDVAPSSSADGQVRIEGAGYNGYLTLDGNGLHVGHNSSSRVITLDTNETERVRINAAGLVGLGTNNPVAELHVKGAGEILRIETTDATGHAYATFHDASARKGYVGFGSASTEQLIIDNEETGGEIHLINGGSVRLNVNSSGDVSISTNLIVSSAQVIGGFGAETTAGTADWNDATNARSGNGYTLLAGNATNGPTSTTDLYHAFSFEYASKDGTGNLTQYAVPYLDPAHGMYVRCRYVGTWTAWSRVVTAGSTGAIKNSNPRFQVGAGGTLQSPTTNDSGRIKFTNKDIDVGSCIDISGTASTTNHSAFVAPVAGTYYFYSTLLLEQDGVTAPTTPVSVYCFAKGTAGATPTWTNLISGVGGTGAYTNNAALNTQYVSISNNCMVTLAAGERVIVRMTVGLYYGTHGVFGGYLLG